MAEVKTYIAHENHTLVQHLLGVAAKTKHFSAKLNLSESGELIGVLHDLGKYSAEFQAYIQSAIGLVNEDEDDYVDAHGLKGKVDHSTAGAQLIWGELSKHGGMESIVGQILALCVAAHHSGLIDCLSSGANAPAEDNFTKRMLKAEARTHLREVKGKMDAEINARFQALIAAPELLEGVKKSVRQLMQNDLIKGLDPSQNKITQFKIGLLVRFLFSCLIDADRIDTADAERPRAAKWRPPSGAGEN